MAIKLSRNRGIQRIRIAPQSGPPPRRGSNRDSRGPSCLKCLLLQFKQKSNPTMYHGYPMEAPNRKRGNQKTMHPKESRIMIFSCSLLQTSSSWDFLLPLLRWYGCFGSTNPAALSSMKSSKILPSSILLSGLIMYSFGGFASKYIKGRFFMDVHPPLAKLLLTLAGWLAGFDGNFDFKEIGKDYVEPGVPYVAMRLLPALMGVMTIPTIFLTLKATGCRTTTAALGAGLIIFENGLLTQSRLILLDSPLIIFTAFTALSWTCFTNQHEQGPSKAFDASWWFWLVSTGFGLGATVSVKWVGLFTIAWVGSLTVVQLWVLLGDTVTVTPVGLPS